VGNRGTKPAIKKFFDFDNNAIIITAAAPSRHFRNNATIE
jgi:hypothetical protein